MKKLTTLICAAVTLCAASGYAQNNLTHFYSCYSDNDMSVKVSTPEEDGSFMYYVESNNLINSSIDEIKIVLKDSEIEAFKSAIGKARAIYDKKNRSAAKKSAQTEAIKVKFPNAKVYLQDGKNRNYVECALISAITLSNGSYMFGIFATPLEEQELCYAGCSVVLSPEEIDSFLRCFDRDLANAKFAEIAKVEALFE